jgi:hypothetical protein
VALNLLVYDPPIAGFPYLAVAVETEAPGEVVYAETHPTLADAEAAIVRLAGRLESQALPPERAAARSAGGG